MSRIEHLLNKIAYFTPSQHDGGQTLWTLEQIKDEPELIKKLQTIVRSFEEIGRMDKI